MHQKQETWMSIPDGSIPVVPWPSKCTFVTVCVNVGRCTCVGSSLQYTVYLICNCDIYFLTSTSAQICVKAMGRSSYLIHTCVYKFRSITLQMSHNCLLLPWGTRSPPVIPLKWMSYGEVRHYCVFAVIFAPWKWLSWFECVYWPISCLFAKRMQCNVS